MIETQLETPTPTRPATSHDALLYAPNIFAADRQAVKIQTIRRVAFVLIVIGLVLKGITIFTADTHTDANFYLSSAHNFLVHGDWSPYMWRLDYGTNSIAGGGTGYGVVTMFYWLKAFGFSVTSGRVFTYVAGLGTLALVFLAARAWFGAQAAVAATAFTAVNGLFFRQINVRMDALGVVSYTAVLWLFVVAHRRGKWWLHTLTGLAAIATTEVHILGMLTAAGLALSYSVDHIRTALKKDGRWLTASPFVFFLLGAIPMGVLYLLVHVLPDPDAYFVVARSFEEQIGAGPVKEVARYFFFAVVLPLETLLLVWALIAAFRRGEDRDLRYAMTFIGTLIGLAVFSVPLNIQYASHLLPVMALGVGALVAYGYTPRSFMTQQRLTIAAITGVILLLLSVRSLAEQTPTSTIEDDPRVDYVRTYVSTDTVVMGDPLYYSLLLDYGEFLSYNVGEVHGILLRGEDHLTFWAREQPEVIMLDPYDVDEPADELLIYIQETGFVEVQTGLWVRLDLWQQIVEVNPAPDVTYTATTSDIAPGDCVTLNWSAEGVDAVMWGEHSAEPEDAVTVCPVVSTGYDLVYQWAGGTERLTQMVNVE